jgi:hypothetical protein
MPEGQQAPGPDQPVDVPSLLEHREGLRDLPAALLQPALGAGPHPQRGPVEQRPGAGPPLAAGLGQPGRLGHDPGRLVQPVLVGEDLAEGEQQLQAVRVGRRQQPGRPGQKLGGGRRVAPCQGLPAGRGQVVSGPPGQPGRRLVGAELGPVAGRLLEVVPDDLLELGLPLAAGPGHPGGHALVQGGPVALGQGGVGGVAQQQVAEPEGVLAAEARPAGLDQLLAGEGAQVPVHPGP